MLLPTKMLFSLLDGVLFAPVSFRAIQCYKLIVEWLYAHIPRIECFIQTVPDLAPNSQFIQIPNNYHKKDMTEASLCLLDALFFVR
jgi:hypothetical protein